MKKILNNKLNLFLIISLSGILIFGIWIINAGDIKPAKWLAIKHEFNWQFSDFFRQIVYSSDLPDIYFNTNDAPFPPLAYLFYNIFYKMNPKSYIVDLRSWQECMNFEFNALIFLMVQIISVIFLYAILRKFLKNIGEKKFLLFMLSLLLSAPFLSGAIERGNSSLMVLPLVLLALYWKDSNNKLYRQLSLVLLAIATGFKLYPAIFIVLWLKDKRIKDIFLFGLYCGIFVLLPFAFTGGVDGFIQYCKNLSDFADFLILRWTSLELYLYSICITLDITYVVTIAKVIKWLFLILGCLYAIFAKEKWKACLPLATLMAVFIANSNRYVAIYLLIPLVYFLTDNKKMKFLDYIYIILFALIFTIPMWAVKLEVDFAIFTPIYLLNIILLIETICSIIKNRKNIIQNVQMNIQKLKLINNR